MKRRRRALLSPLGWASGGDVRGPFTSVPRVDEGSWEVGRNETGQYFIRPRTEFTGLDPAYKALFAAFDRQTGAQKEQIGRSYADATAGAGKDADALTARLGSLAALSGGAASTFAGQAPATDTGGLAQDILATGGRQAARQSAFDVNIASLLPTALRGEGQSALAAYAGGRDDSKIKALFDARSAQQASDSAAAQLDATVSGKQSDLELRRQGLANDLKIADIRSKATTDAAATAAAARRYAADKAAEDSVATGEAAKRAAGAQALGPAASAAHDLWNDGLPKYDFGGTPIPGSAKTGLKSQYRLPLLGVGPLFRQMLARGLSPQEAQKIAAATVGKDLWAKWYKLQGKKFGI